MVPPVIMGCAGSPGQGSAHVEGLFALQGEDGLILNRFDDPPPNPFLRAGPLSRPPEHAAFAKQPGCGMMEQRKIAWSGAEKMSEITVSAVHLSTLRRMDLGALWIDGRAYHIVTMRLPNTRMLHCYVPDGESCRELPEPREVSMPGEGMDGVTVWHRQDSDAPFDPDTEIMEDLSLYAVMPGA